MQPLLRLPSEPAGGDCWIVSGAITTVSGSCRLGSGAESSVEERCVAGRIGAWRSAAAAVGWAGESSWLVYPRLDCGAGCLSDASRDGGVVGLRSRAAGRCPR